MWLTLPVTPQGLNPNALAVVREMLAAKVDLAGVNVMAMDFGVPSAARNMRGAITSRSPRARSSLPRSTPVPGHQFRRQARSGPRTDVVPHRDSQCGVTFALIGTHSNLCGGVVQKPLQFTKTFVELRGNARATAAAVTTPDLRPQATTATADNPARSPYPIFQPTLAYRENYKVVWHQAVYIAKWYSQGQTPDSVNATGTVSPWRLIGPVLRTDRAPQIPKLAAGTYPTWAASKVFIAGDRVVRACNAGSADCDLWGERIRCDERDVVATPEPPRVIPAGRSR